MKAGDVNTWLEVWDQQSKAEIEDKLEHKQGYRELLLQQWSELFSGNVKIFLTRYFEIGNDVVVAYRLYGDQSPEKEYFIAFSVQQNISKYRASTKLMNTSMFKAVFAN